MTKKATKTQIKHLRALIREKKTRDKTGQFIAEGFKIISDAIEKKHIPEQVIVSNSFLENFENKKFLKGLEKLKVKTLYLGDSDFEQISSLKNSQGILAVIKKPEEDYSFTSEESEIVVLCDGVQDPGNLGAIIRTAVAFGVKAVLVTGDNVDMYNPKVIRASSGTIFDVFTYNCTSEEIKSLKDIGFELLASSVFGDNAESFNKMKIDSDKILLAFGAEGKGLSDKILKMSDKIFYIPIDEKVESLNVVSAASITLFAVKNALSAG
ncbi:MAG: RNA methyltransferase [Candidatus Omnitrophica bacterium]|nr:RNA methyltransferase [Candidatus Omnitrophota bacterium]